MVNVETLGQVFTPEDIVKQMLELRQNQGLSLEPSCGDGAFSTRIDDCIAVELDPTVCPKGALNIDFFEYPADRKFPTIIGNPPYVRFQDILPSTKRLLDMRFFDSRTNLYMFFIYSCAKRLDDGGELILIVPRDFLKATSCIRFNQWLYCLGTITDLIDLGDRVVFPGFSPNCIIFRFEKDNFSRKTNRNLHFLCSHGQFLFTKEAYPVEFGDVFSVKVGAVSGADEIFQNDAGNEEFVYSKTRETGKTRRMIYNQPADKLLPHKQALLERGIKKFEEKNWWKWGRDQYVSDAPRIYVNCKTRHEEPFFTHPCNNFEGAVMSLFPHKTDIDLDELTHLLNAVDWKDLGFICDGRFLFSQQALEGTVLPESFRKYEVREQNVLFG